MELKQLTLSDERWLRRWMTSYDFPFAMHRQLADYFLQSTDNFGSTGVTIDGKVVAVAFWSRHGGKSFIHRWMGDLGQTSQILEAVRQWLGLPCQLYLTDEQIVGRDLLAWKYELKVTVGYVVDHPAYEGVFARVAPRFDGVVFEHE